MHLGEITETLKKRRKLLGLTQVQFTELSGVSLRAVKALENGKSNPTFKTLNKLTEVLDMELNLEVKLPKFF
ncbi:MAG: helix-turn-helix transcriptional regulator [Bacteroidetes bacterium]|nr:helix-turn-helix transcriptional regulator [Bacteroidota bacterium]